MGRLMRGAWEAEYGGNHGGQGYGLALDGVARAVWRRREPGLGASSGDAAASGQEAAPHVLAKDMEPQFEEQERLAGAERRIANRRMAERRAKALESTAKTTPSPARAPQQSLPRPWNIFTLAAVVASLGLAFGAGLQLASSPETSYSVAAPVPTLQLERDVEALGQRVSRTPP